MKAAIVKDNKIIISKIPKPKLSKKGAIVKVVGCGLCGSDIVKLKSGESKDGTVLGHEVVGEIVEIDSSTNFQIGDRIVLGHHVPCFDCVYCWGENYSMCKQFKKTNIIPGGFAEFIYVSELHLQNTAFIPNGQLTDEEASFLEPLACCVRAVKRAELKYSSKVLVLGLGSIGILMGQALKAMGYVPYGCDLIQDRIDLAKKYNFEDTFISNEKNLKSFKNKYAKAGFDSIIMTSGSDKAIPFALDAIRDGGTIVVFSSVNSNKGYTNNDIYYRELKILGSYSPSPVDLEDSLEMIQSRKVIVENLSTNYKLESLSQAIEDTLKNKIIKAYITI